MTLLLTNADLEQLDVPEAEIVEVVGDAYRDLGTGSAANAPRARMYLPSEGDAPRYWVNNIMGAAPSAGVAAVRLDSSFSRFVRDERGARRVRAGDFVGIVLLFDLQSAELVGILHDHWLSTRRVAAASALGARHLAREDSARLGIIGSGEQARAQVRALRVVRPLAEVRVYSPTTANREAFAEELSMPDCPVVAVDSARQAVAGCDIVITATSARSPVLEGTWLESGTHLVSIVGSDRQTAGSELDEAAVARADVIVVNTREQIRIDGQPTLMPLIESGRLAWEDIGELAEIVAGAGPARTAAEQITFHHNNTGMGIQFSALGALALRRAHAQGLGTELDGELFMTRGGTYAP
ncbi:MAG TPA: ornithine cyclodeaminase family protein [Nocardioidaceae bacterium]|nr:ornithine cyclodeaminase family protein [Nocardioidaceae bacterium]